MHWSCIALTRLQRRKLVKEEAHWLCAADLGADLGRLSPSRLTSAADTGFAPN